MGCRLPPGKDRRCPSASPVVRPVRFRMPVGVTSPPPHRYRSRHAVAAVGAVEATEKPKKKKRDRKRTAKPEKKLDAEALKKKEKKRRMALYD